MDYYCSFLTFTAGQLHIHTISKAIHGCSNPNTPKHLFTTHCHKTRATIRQAVREAINQARAQIPQIIYRRTRQYDFRKREKTVMHPYLSSFNKILHLFQKKIHLFI